MDVEVRIDGTPMLEFRESEEVSSKYIVKKVKEAVGETLTASVEKDLSFIVDILTTPLPSVESTGLPE
jgi:hypothetical protein